MNERRDPGNGPQSVPRPGDEPSETQETSVLAGVMADGESVEEDDRPRWRVMWDRFNYWRRTRPFWGVLALLVGGWFVVSPVIASLEFVAGMGVTGITTWILGGGMIAAALVSLFLPAQRHFPAIMAMILSVASLPLANLGGWLVGMICGIIGSGMIFGWTPYSDKDLARLAAKEERKLLKKAERDARKAQADQAEAEEKA